jgi:predicted house-cleaning NTP pyrophosphatase (Maf/HAM1 superfamily)
VASKNRGAMAADPTSMPIALIADALLDCIAKGETVLDPFAGSGATILAAEKVGAIARGLEQRADCVDVAIERWQRMTGRAATLAGDGRSFATVTESRARLQVASVRHDRAMVDATVESESGEDSEGGAEIEGGGGG